MALPSASREAPATLDDVNDKIEAVMEEVRGAEQRLGERIDGVEQRLGERIGERIGVIEAVLRKVYPAEFAEIDDQSTGSG